MVKANFIGSCVNVIDNDIWDMDKLIAVTGGPDASPDELRTDSFWKSEMPYAHQMSKAEFLFRIGIGGPIEDIKSNPNKWILWKYNSVYFHNVYVAYDTYEDIHYFWE